MSENEKSVFLKARACAARIAADAVKKLQESGRLPQGQLPQITAEVPADSKNGDFSCNIALAGARVFRLPPRSAAELIRGAAELDGSPFARVETAGPGFLNFFFSPDYYCSAIQEILDRGERFGCSDFGGGKKVLVEFVSANPTGPAHMGNARGGALGDCLSSIMQAAGYDVKREFYVNDSGNQIAKFALSLDIRYRQLFLGEDAVRMPEDSYHGDDIKEHAAEFAALYGDSYMDRPEEERRKALTDFALPKNIAALRSNMEKYRIEYDRWFSESSLYENGSVEKIIEMLKASGRTYERGGALWFMAGGAPDCPDDPGCGDQDGADEKDFHKDFVLVRANGFPTYIVPDAAYHYDKLVTRNFDTAIDVWGSDHHGYMMRLKQVLGCLGIDPDRLEVILMQLVKLTRNGEAVRMSKRTGKMITLSDLLEEIPIDAVRFLFNMRTPESQMEFDLDLAVQQTAQNPVYYTQYAHARICSILKNLAAEGIAVRRLESDCYRMLDKPDERALTVLLSSFPSVIIESARSRDPSGVTRYAVEVAAAFHKFYTQCHVNCGECELTQARIALCMAARTVLRNILTMLKISVPESM